MSRTGTTLAALALPPISCTPWLVIRSPATWAARLESDCMSEIMTVNLCFLPSPMTNAVFPDVLVEVVDFPLRGGPEGRHVAGDREQRSRP